MKRCIFFVKKERINYFIVDVNQINSGDIYLNYHYLPSPSNHFSIHKSGQRHEKTVLGWEKAVAFQNVKMPKVSIQEVHGKGWALDLINEYNFPSFPYDIFKYSIDAQKFSKGVTFLFFLIPEKFSTRKALTELDERRISNIQYTFVLTEMKPKILVVVRESNVKKSSQRETVIPIQQDGPISTNSTKWVTVGTFKFNKRQYERK